MYGSDYGSWMHGSGMFGGGLVMILMWLIPILLVVALIVFLTKRPGFGPNKKTSLDILKESNSRGEIGKGEFAQRKRDIDGISPDGSSSSPKSPKIQELLARHNALQKSGKV